MKSGQKNNTSRKNKIEPRVMLTLFFNVIKLYPLAGIESKI